MSPVLALFNDPTPCINRSLSSLWYIDPPQISANTPKEKGITVAEVSIPDDVSIVDLKQVGKEDVDFLERCVAF